MNFSLCKESPLPLSYDIVACRNCGMQFANTAASTDDYNHYYSQQSKYEDAAIATGGGDTQLDKERLSTTAQIITNNLKMNDPLQFKILDIGCARGGLLKEFRAQGYQELYGIDPSAACVASLNNDEISAQVGSLTNLETSNKFDLILLVHVLEHILDVKQAINSIYKKMKCNGYLYIEVPDAARYIQFNQVPFYYFDSEHINHFNIESLHNLAAEHKLEVISKGTRNISVQGGGLYPACWIILKKTEHSLSNIKPSNSDCIREYIKYSTSQNTYPTLLKLSKSQDPIILWGAGSFAQRLLAKSPLSECNISAIIDMDSNKQGRELHGNTIQNPSYIEKAPRNSIVIIAVALGGNDLKLKLSTKWPTLKFYIPTE